MLLFLNTHSRQTKTKKEIINCSNKQKILFIVSKMFCARWKIEFLDSVNEYFGFDFVLLVFPHTDSNPK